MRGARLQSVDLQVGQQERLGVGVSLESDARSVAHGAVGSVAADDVAGPHRLLAALPMAQAAGDVLALRLGAHQLRAPLDGDVPCGEAGREDRLRLRLREEEQEGVRRVVAADVEHRHVQRAAGQMQVQPDRRVPPVDQFVRHAEPGQHLQGAGLDGRGA
ncbi:hypothetical protein QF034_000354 [Streptomyces africanus]|uniref:Uncharacterized protein n=1 Tax=Streptomyces africanus TaxID=231024 RepID=A0ABU0QFF0_9ACTN|nr:hypothetical protein [Streptomyces africanus]